MLQAASASIHSHGSPFTKVPSQVCWKRTWPKTRVFDRFSSLSYKSRSALFPTSINPVCAILAILKHKKICQDECNHCKVISFKPFKLLFNLKVNTLCFEVIYFKESLPHLKIIINVSGTCYHLILEMPVKLTHLSQYSRHSYLIKLSICNQIQK